MPHMVVFRTNEGKPGYHLAETLDDAVRFVEHLRNNEQVAESKVYRMHEVPIEFKVMYKVEVAGSAPAQAEDAGASEAVRAAEKSASPEPRPQGDQPRPQRDQASPRDAGESVRAVAQPGPSATAPSGPVAQSGGRFGLFSRA